MIFHLVKKCCCKYSYESNKKEQLFTMSFNPIFKLKPDTFLIQTEGDIPTFIPEFFSGKVIIPSPNIFPGKDIDLIKFQFQLIKAGRMKINFNNKELQIDIEKSENWIEFFNSNTLDIIGLITIFTLVPTVEDILWIEPGFADKVLILGIMQKNNRWEGRLIERKPPELNPDYFLSGVFDRKEHAKELFEQFQAWLGPEFSSCSHNYTPGRKPLTVKVHPKSSWFLLFPLSHFCQFGYGIFSFYNEPEWILTQKPFIQNCCERLQIEYELSDIQTILQHSVIIINTYEHWNSEVITKSKEGVALIKEVLSLLTNIYFQNSSQLSLRWYINPIVSEVQQELENPDIWYFFADFHVEDGAWQPGAGERCNWHSQTITDPKKEQPIREEKDFNFHRQGSFSHIRLMRVFHCESVFDVGRIYEKDSTPADAHTIVRLLLNAGARRVEGGMTMESYFDYLCSLFDLLCREQGLGPILIGQCLEKGVNYENLLVRINNFLKLFDWELIQ